MKHFLVAIVVLVLLAACTEVAPQVKNEANVVEAAFGTTGRKYNRLADYCLAAQAAATQAPVYVRQLQDDLASQDSSALEAADTLLDGYLSAARNLARSCTDASDMQNDYGNLRHDYNQYYTQLLQNSISQAAAETGFKSYRRRLADADNRIDRQLRKIEELKDRFNQQTARLAQQYVGFKGTQIVIH